MNRKFTNVSVSREDLEDIKIEFLRYKRILKRRGIKNISNLMVTGAFEILERMKKDYELDLEQRRDKRKRISVATV